MSTTEPDASRTAGNLGRWTGVGLVVANMVGAGVFLSFGFMAQDLGPYAILAAWLVGAFLALCGTQCYAAAARLVPRSGGEYRYLSDLLHPFLGNLAGWASLLFGFSAPIAIDALAAGAFSATLWSGVNARWIGTAVVVALTLVHAVGLRPSAGAQNLLVAVKTLLLLGFVGIGLVLGSHAAPAWHPPSASDGFPLAAFANNLFFVAFAFCGWNAAAYAAAEFKRPERDVPAAMLIGCLLVSALYLLVNWVFTANLTPEIARGVFAYDQLGDETGRVTLAHLLLRHLVGDSGARLASVLLLVVFVSSASAMMLVGPRVYSAMAADGFLPRWLAARSGRPPIGSVVLQGGLALVILHAHSLAALMSNLGAVLTLFSALTAVSIFRARGRSPRPSRLALAAATVYGLASAWMLYHGFRMQRALTLWFVAFFAVSGVAYVASRRSRRRAGDAMGT